MVRARLVDEIDNTAARGAELSGEVVGLNPKLLNGVHGWKDREPVAVIAHRGRADTVQQDVILAVPSTVHREISAHGVVAHRSRGARNQHDQRERVSLVERQVDDGLPFDYVADSRGGGIQ